MSTHASITLKTESGSFRTIYNHFDGGPFYLGKILFNHYKKLDDVIDLINLGDASYIGETLDHPTSKFYGRAQETFSKVKFREYTSLEAMYIKESQNVNYLYDASIGKWFILLGGLEKPVELNEINTTCSL